MSDDDLDELMRAAFAARRAERLRRQAIDVAHEYARNARTLRLDADIVRLDVEAVVSAWQQIA